MENDIIGKPRDLLCSIINMNCKNKKVELEKNTCVELLKYLDYLESKNAAIESINGRLNNKLSILKESYKDLIDRV